MATWRSGSIAAGTPQVRTGRRSWSLPAATSRGPARPRLLRLANKRADEGAALVGVRPSRVQTFPVELICQRVGGHGVVQLGQRAIPDFFVAADVVAFAQRARRDQ